jgi:predicted ester cyclase
MNIPRRVRVIEASVANGESSTEVVMGKDENIAAQVKFGEAVVSGNLDGIREVVDAKALDHDPGPGQGLGPDGFIHYFSGLRKAFPDLNIVGDKLVADDDNIAIAYTISGTHQGEFMGIAPTGRKISARGVQIARFENGKLVERWGSSDQLGILQQLGVKAAGA